MVCLFDAQADAMTQTSTLSAAKIIAGLRTTNAGRNPELLAMKYAKMQQSPFVFLRGACHLFYAALPDTPLFRQAPLTWACGDLHFENFGSYKGDNRQVYFDINDYDEGALAPASWDLVRLLSSIRCGADDLKLTPAAAKQVSRDCLDAYCRALSRGKPRWVERETASGMISELFAKLQNQKRADFLDKRTTLKGKHRQLKLDGIKALPASAAERKKVEHFMQQFAATQATPKFFEVIDVARRIAGTGSLGVERYVVLIEGKGSPDSNYLLDIKEARPSSLSAPLAERGIKQPDWPDAASRIATIQQRLQAIDHAFLQAVSLAGQACILRDLQPSEDRVAITAWGKKLENLSEVVASMGEILAWDQLRAAGRSGSANADALIAFAARADWQDEMLAAAEEMNRQNQAQWEIFGKALTDGQLA